MEVASQHSKTPIMRVLYGPMSELLLFYWELGGQIVERQTCSTWRDSFLKQLSADLMAECPDIKGFPTAISNTYRSGTSFTIVKNQLGNSLLPNWFRFRRHNLAIISKPKSLDEATFYIENTLAHGWSRSVLTHQIESGLWQRKGSALTRALPEELQSRLPSLESIEAELNKGS